MMETLAKKFDVKGYPSLVLIDGKTGETMTTAGRNPVQATGASGFPWSEEAMANAKAAKKAEQEKGLVALKGLLTNNSTAGAAAVASESQHILFWFSRSG